MERKIGYQGLIYREAVENLEAYIQNTTSRDHVFLGFNALNAAEEIIIQELLQNDLASIYWDIDKEIIDHPFHDAGLFMRHYLNHWPHYRTHDFRWKTTKYSEKKHIEVIGVPKNIGQSKYIGTLLESMISKGDQIQNTAIVLADENLLIPTLNSLPNSIEAINITMGLPVQSIPLATLFEKIFNLHKNNKKVFYYKDVMGIISHQFIRPLLNTHNDVVSEISDIILKNNIVYITLERMVSIAHHNKDLLELLFTIGTDPVSSILSNCQRLIVRIKSELDRDRSENKLALEYLFRFNELFNELVKLNDNYTYIQELNSLHSVYNELLSRTTLDFQGEPLEGLQLMGMLESRVLDFETVIISSVNEGILPAGKTNNSFIPYDVKIENNLPTYKEKDAIYSYHFYRLLYRAKNVFILYNTEMDALTGGERSRFITQMEIQGIHKLNHKIISPKVDPQHQSSIQVHKTDTILRKLNELGQKGISPSALTNYIRNPMDFYYEKIIGIKTPEEVEESVAMNTLGTIVHNTLEDLYKGFIGDHLDLDTLSALTPKVNKVIEHHFKIEFYEGDISKGKNLIIFEIAKRYVLNFINKEIEDLKQGNQIKIIGLEREVESKLFITEIGTEIKLTGKVDRIDQYNGVVRIIDYKTGKVTKDQVVISDWELLTTDYKKYSKSFQLLMYAYLLKHSGEIDLPVEAGIVSFKNLNSGVLKFLHMESKSKDPLISDSTLSSFEMELKRILIEIFDPEVNFIEKAV